MALRERGTVRGRCGGLSVRVIAGPAGTGALRIAGEERLRGAQQELLQRSWYAGVLLVLSFFLFTLCVFSLTRAFFLSFLSFSSFFLIPWVGVGLVDRLFWVGVVESERDIVLIRGA